MESRRLALLALTIAIGSARAWGAANPVPADIPPPCPYKIKALEMPVSDAVKAVVLKRAGVAWSDRGKYVFDSTIPQEWGGSPDIDNVTLMSKDEAARKHKVEESLAECICIGQTNLATAKSAVTNWRRALSKELPFDADGRCPVRP
jgi:hypothetical protein